jgi:hypothetical protein
VTTREARGALEVTVTRGAAYRADEGGVIALGALAGRDP